MSTASSPSFFVATVMVVWVAGAQAAPPVEIARVNGRTLTEVDLVQYLNSTLVDGAKTPEMNTPDGRAQAIQALVDQEVLVGFAEKEKLDQSEEFKSSLAMARRQLLINQLVSKKLASRLTEAEAKKFYESRPHLFSTDQARVVHVLVPTEVEALQVLEKAKAPGVDLQDLAEKMSKDPTAKQNRGDLGYFTRDHVVPEFASAAFTAKVGTLVGPIKTVFGYHVMKVIDRKIGRVRGFPEVEVQARALHREEVLRTFLGGLKDQAQVQILASPKKK